VKKIIFFNFPVLLFISFYTIENNRQPSSMEITSSYSCQETVDSDIEPGGYFLDHSTFSSKVRMSFLRRPYKKIYISIYKIGNEVGDMHWAILKEAVDQGADVKVIIDDLATVTKRKYLRYLESLGIDIKRFNPLFRRGIKGFLPGNITKRMHDKLVILGDKNLIIGDRNISDEYFNKKEGGHYFKTNEILIQDHLTNKLATDYFLELWNSGLAVDFKRKKKLSKRKIRKYSERLSSAQDKLSDEQIDFKFCKVSSLILSHDVPNQKGKVAGSSKAIFDLIASATQRIVIQNPYVYLTKNMKKALSEARSRGVEVLILTNSLANNDMKNVQKALYGDLDWFEQSGVNLYEYMGHETLHMKNILVDKTRGYIGSYNLDPRSEKLNHETGIIFDSIDIAHQLEIAIEENLNNADVLVGNGKIMREPKKGRIFRALFLPFIRNQL
jgi:putative cardiolipin synthase